jgi:hypothetical protein
MNEIERCTQMSLPGKIGREATTKRKPLSAAFSYFFFLAFFFRVSVLAFLLMSAPCARL